MQKDEPKSTDVIYDIAFNRLEAQIKQVDGIDIKLNFAFSVASLIIGIAVSLFVGLLDEVNTLSRVFFVGGAFSYITYSSI